MDSFGSRHILHEACLLHEAWLADLEQSALTQKIGIALAAFGKLDDRFGDYGVQRVVAVPKSKRDASCLECEPHDPFGLRFELVVHVQEWGYGHGYPPGLKKKATPLARAPSTRYPTLAIENCENGHTLSGSPQQALFGASRIHAAVSAPPKGRRRRGMCNLSTS